MPSAARSRNDAHGRERVNQTRDSEFEFEFEFEFEGVKHSSFVVRYELIERCPFGVGKGVPLVRVARVQALFDGMSQAIKVLGCGGQVADDLSDAALLLPQLPSFAAGHVLDQPARITAWPHDNDCTLVPESSKPSVPRLPDMASGRPILIPAASQPGLSQPAWGRPDHP